MKRLFILFWAIAALPAVAQTRRIVQPLELWAEAQGELALKNGDYLLLTLHGENAPQYNGRSASAERTFSFATKGAAVAYEHFWNDHWSGGAALQYVSVYLADFVVPEASLRHRSQLGSLTFGQRIGAYRTVGFGDYGRTVGNGEGQNWLTLRADLEKRLPVGGGVALRPRLSYEAVARVAFKKDPLLGEERTINYTSLRAEVGCRINDHLDFTPWFAYTTTYFFTLPQYSPTGQPTSGGRLNLVTPVLGLDARFTLFQGKAAFERRQLPTQH